MEFCLVRFVCYHFLKRDWRRFFKKHSRTLYLQVDEVFLQVIAVMFEYLLQIIDRSMVREPPPGVHCSTINSNVYTIDLVAKFV